MAKWSSIVLYANVMSVMLLFAQTVVILRQNTVSVTSALKKSVLKMKMIDLDGREVEWRPKGRSQHKGRVSKLQHRAVDIVLSVLPGTLILQEVAIPISSKKGLYLDIYLPIHKIGIEVHGRQHNKQVPFFQDTKQFARQRINDELKAKWFEQNNIPLLVFYHNESNEQWISKIKQALFHASKDY